MSFGDNPGGSENLQGEGRQQALQAMIRGSADTYASMLNMALFPFRLYQQSLVVATQVALDSLQAATGVVQQGMPGSNRVAQRSVETSGGTVRSDMRITQQSTATGVATDWAVRQGIEAGRETARQDMEAINRAAQDKMRATAQAALQQNAEATGETARESYAETAGRTSTEVGEAASRPSEPAPTPSLEVSNAVGELPPSPAPEAARPAAETTVAETDEGSVETSSRAAGTGDEAPPLSSAPVPSSTQEEPVTVEELPPTQEEKSPAGEATNTIEELELPPPPEVSDVELPPPPTAETMDEPAAQTTRREVPRVHVRRTKATAAARREAEEINVDLADVEGTGRDGQVTVGDVRKKAGEQQA